LVGNKSLRAVAVETLSRRCSKCEYKVNHTDNICSKNYDGSSKGMEAKGAFQNVRLLFEDKIVIIDTS
jgi:D-arabinose 1-dehydrogenase-like Zn-dependent alcohol dehydrogenase